MGAHISVDLTTSSPWGDIHHPTKEVTLRGAHLFLRHGHCVNRTPKLVGEANSGSGWRAKEIRQISKTRVEAGSA